MKQHKLRALADYDNAIEPQPLFSDAYVNRAVLHLTLRHFKAALDDLDTAIRLNPKDVTALTNRATIKLALEKYDDALADLSAALQLNLGNAALYLGRGRENLFAGALDNSIADFKIAVRLRPSNPYPAIWSHIARVHKGDVGAAPHRDANVGGGQRRRVVDAVAYLGNGPALPPQTPDDSLLVLGQQVGFDVDPNCPPIASAVRPLSPVSIRVRIPASARSLSPLSCIIPLRMKERDIVKLLAGVWHHGLSISISP